MKDNRLTEKLKEWLEDILIIEYKKERKSKLRLKPYLEQTKL